ncbi:hypothetical protein [Noviherbaspirillum autotrophicum]|nr:hypothetical protein [Noviherbaspirillum autotrophicum]
MASLIDKLHLVFVISLFPFFAGHALSEVVHENKMYSPQERQAEEARIRQKIEERLDWKNRSPEKLDDLPDADRMLIGGLNESILLRQENGERFGLFESFRDADNIKIIEVRLHKKNKLTDRFPVYPSGLCDKGVDISADKVMPSYVVYSITCTSKKYGMESSPYLFDYMSRNMYQLAVLDYDPIENKAPDIKLENGIYKMSWNVRLRGAKKNTLVVRNFKILKDAKGDWAVKELPPIDDEAAAVPPLKKLPIKSEYDLPAFVANWGKR